MKDTQVTTASAEPRVFLLSPVLHCVSMTALVFLRSSFGYAFLRPKSFFFAVSWAFLLFAIYAWIDGDAWAERRVLLWFGLSAVTLYWLHFSVTISREWRSVGRHDNDLGTPIPNFLLRLFGKSSSDRFDRRLRLLVEPGIIIGLAVVFYFLMGERHLSAWLLFTGFCMCMKEVLNQWFSIRRGKRGDDIADDVAEAFNDTQTGEVVRKPLPATAARKARVKRDRNSGLSRDNEQRIIAP